MQGAQRETPVHVSSWDSSGPRAALFHPRLSDGVSVPCLSPVMMCPDLAKTVVVVVMMMVMIIY